MLFCVHIATWVRSAYILTPGYVREPRFTTAANTSAYADTQSDRNKDVGVCIHRGKIERPSRNLFIVKKGIKANVLPRWLMGNVVCMKKNLHLCLYFIFFTSPVSCKRFNL